LDQVLRRFLLHTASVVIATLSLVVLFNVIEDPYHRFGTRRIVGLNHAYRSVGTLDWLPLRSRLIEVTRSDAPIVLVGTSRTKQGFDTSAEPQMFNTGIGGADVAELRKIVDVASRRPIPPRMYVVETSPIVARDDARGRHVEIEPGLFESTISAAVTRASMMILTRSLAGRDSQLGSRDFFAPPRDHDRPTPTDGELRIHPWYTYALIAPSGVELETYLRGMAMRCAATKASLIVHEPPIHPHLSSHVAIGQAKAERMRAYERILNDLRVELPACCIRFIDAGARDAHVCSDDTDPAHWYDSLHFDGIAGAAILDRVLSSAGECGLLTLASATR